MDWQCNAQLKQSSQHYYMPPCGTNNFNLGYLSHIRGEGNGPIPSHVFPGTAQLGNESGANGPIFIDAFPGYWTELKRRYDLQHRDFDRQFRITEVFNNPRSY